MRPHFHTFATLGEGRQFDACQLCGTPPPDVVCVDCDLEACSDCIKKGDHHGQVHESQPTTSAS